MIMNEQEHDFDQRPPEERQEKTVAQRISERVTGELIDAKPVEFDEDAVDPFADEYTEGINARKEGRTEDDCPYDSGTFERNNWIGGWKFAEKAMEEQ